MVFFAFAAILALVSVTSVAAQVAQYVPKDSSSKGILYSVNIPSSTASSKSGPIYLQLVAPSGTQWLGLGQGKGMDGANMFLLYAAGGGNVTISPRSSTGNVMPKYNSAAQVMLLDGSGMSSDGTLTANVRCDSCLSWGSGTMDPTSTTSSWIWAVKRGASMNTNDVSTSISQHDDKGSFSFNLQAGTGGSTNNPFSQAATGGSAASSASASASAATPAASSLGSDPTATPSSSSSDSSSGSDSGSGSGSNTIRKAHGILMAIVFIIALPLGALMIYLPFSKKVLFAHAPLQILNACALVAGLALGVVQAQNLGMVDGYHQIIGYVVVAVLLLFQPALGLIQHMYYRKHGTKTGFGRVHHWLGRILILLGIINGGLGLHQSGGVGSLFDPTWAVVVYSVIAGVVGLFYIAVAVSSRMRQGKGASSKRRSDETDDYRGNRVPKM